MRRTCGGQLPVRWKLSVVDRRVVRMAFDSNVLRKLMQLLGDALKNLQAAGVDNCSARVEESRFREGYGYTATILPDANRVRFHLRKQHFLQLHFDRGHVGIGLIQLRLPGKL